ncbi:Bug family tripartite tricarboxylate transporter substrate binding protein [Hydrogenophaga sp. BPS33]|uniref:Bug family tripartite tricarboxylate transporter substrate binding protein n=1 Tax=Hydrogenophaga sp. BPS33 TaxID=2651974 RepID=UPI00132051F0|nr:tripartite tricarboxylate transporter substrate binding protein [Hydrogenophaga sp. BPS33]QHE87093.1 tripartite tricarboxylate transporter substrate binding protein [Hydrogenophaga sp. BPS33]
MNRRLVFLASLAALAASPFAHSDVAFPNKAVTFVVPLAVGGGTDILARKLAQNLSTLWSQSIVVENVSGASSIIGTQRVARSQPDAHTLLVTTNGAIVGNRFLFKSLPYDPDKDLVPVAQLADIDMVLLAHQSLAAKNLKELVAQARKDPGSVTYASYGIGSQPHLLMELFNKREGIQITHVPYKGLGPALTSVMAGETMLTLTGRGSGDAAIRSGKTKVLNYNADKRDPLHPDVPVSAESGYPYFRVATWHGVFAPRGTPKEVVAKIHKDILTVLNQPEFREDMVKRGYGVPTRSPDEFAAVIQEEVRATGDMVKAAGLKPE